MIIATVNNAALNSGVGQTPDITTVGDTSTEIVGTNLARSSIFLINIGKNDVWISCDADAILGRGIFLARNGGSMLIDQTAFTTGPVNGIADSGRTSDITFQELNK